LNGMADEIGQSLHRILKMDTVVGLGKTMASISHVPNAWAEVQQAMRHRKLHETNQIIDLNEPMNEDSRAAQYPFMIESDLIHSLFIGLGGDSGRLLNVFFQELKKNSELELFLQQGSLKLLGAIQASIMQSGIIQAGSLYDWGQLYTELLALKEKAILSLQQGYRTHLKVKLFGELELDKAIVRAAREIIGQEAFLVGDVNNGYCKTTGVENLDEIAAALHHAVGLSACEDPASLTTEQWIQLQNLVGELHLLPDAPLRPAVEAIHSAVPGMGRIYNIHPGCAGSIIHAVQLARTIQAFGARLMIGDDSLVGPACTVWQQLAIGLAADWVEALEKPGESDMFEACVNAQATSRTSDGRVTLTELAPGFGLELDHEQLKEKCQDYLMIR
jgi:L-alanine-DL-glutamate epimerase-like enolase superfamily enzyme